MGLGRLRRPADPVADSGVLRRPIRLFPAFGNFGHGQAALVVTPVRLDRPSVFDADDELGKASIGLLRAGPVVRRSHSFVDIDAFARDRVPSREDDQTPRAGWEPLVASHARYVGNMLARGPEDAISRGLNPG
jgi:hypothetical protein